MQRRRAIHTAVSYVDHEAEEFNVKVVWLAGDVDELAKLTKGFARFRAKASVERLALERGEVVIVSARLPPYRRLDGYHVRFHFFVPSGDAPLDDVLWRGADAVVARPQDDVPRGVLRVDRAAHVDVSSVAERLSDEVVAALADGSPEQEDFDSYLHVGAFPFLVNLEGLEARVDTTEARVRLVIDTPNGYDLIVLVHPREAVTTDEIIEQFSRTWGSAARSRGPVMAGFHFSRAVFEEEGNRFARYEVLAGPVADSHMVLVLREATGAVCVEELRRYFLTMVEGAILRSPANRLGVARLG